VSTDLAQNQIASFYTGAMARACDLSFYALETKPEIAIISPNDPAAMIKYARECREIGIPYIYDPSQQVARVDGDELVEGLTGAEILILNDYEYSILQKKTALREAQILERVNTIIVTLGEEGSRIVTQDGEVHVPVAKPEAILEPTGVGDAYRAGLIKGLVHGYGWAVTGRIAALAAAYVIEHPGPQPKPYTIHEFVDRYRANFGDTPALQDILGSSKAN
jgi:adenosine kinase